MTTLSSQTFTSEPQHIILKFAVPHDPTKGHSSLLLIDDSLRPNVEPTFGRSGTELEIPTSQQSSCFSYCAFDSFLLVARQSYLCG